MNVFSPNQLILLFSLIFFLTFIDIVRRDLYFGLAYFSLYLYVIFTAIGYQNYPEISKFINAYFGPEVFPGFMGFIILSFLGFYVVFRLGHPLLSRIRLIVSDRPSRHPPELFYLCIGPQIAYLTAFLYWKGDLLSYSMMANETFTRTLGLPFTAFVVLFKLSVPGILVLYTALRMHHELPGRFNTRAFSLMLFLEVIVFVVIVTLTKNRADPIALMAGILIFESQFIRLTPKKILAATCGVLALLWGLYLLEAARDASHYQGGTLEGLIYKDYYGPAHILLAAMSRDFVDPWEVLKSNTSNALILLNYPYLQATVADLFNPGASSRSSSYAFYIFTEGFLVMGWLGWIYNAVVVSAGFFSWRVLLCSDHRPYRLFAFALLGTQVVNLVRGQSSYFLKTGYMYLIPAFILFYFATGIRPRKVQVWKMGALE